MYFMMKACDALYFDHVSCMIKVYDVETDNKEFCAGLFMIWLYFVLFELNGCLFKTCSSENKNISFEFC